jgi:hypothetical protein
VRSRRFTGAFAPLFWYFLITLIVPALNGATEHHAGSFWEHSACVVLVTLPILLLFLIARYLLGWKARGGTAR